jgi:hypothetical protein
MAVDPARFHKGRLHGLPFFIASFLKCLKTPYFHMFPTLLTYLTFSVKYAMIMPVNEKWKHLSKPLFFDNKRKENYERKKYLGRSHAGIPRFPFGKLDPNGLHRPCGRD